MIINYPKDEMLLIPNPDIHFEDNLFSLGINLDVSEKNEIYVEGVWENSSADKANIQVGDLVLSFDSIKATPENLIDLIEMLKDNNVKSIIFEIKNKDKIKKITLNKTLLF
jgi:S1-C subfamily serine protease